MFEHSYRARWILSLERPPILDGVLMLREKSHSGTPPNQQFTMITGLKDRPWRYSGSVIDFGDAIIIPGLVNAHTHLEFSQLEGPIGTSEMPFTEWIKSVVAWRRQRDDGWDRARGASPSHVSSIRAGIKESLHAGATLLGEIGTALESASLLEDSDAGGVAFWEMIGWSAASISQNMEQARRFIFNWPVYFTGVVRGLSPHAPYTVHQDLLRAIVDESSKRGFPVAMHLAETEAELQLLASGTGPFAQMLQALDAWDPSALIANSRPLDYLQILSKAHRAIIVHGNYLDQREIEFLAENRANMSVVYCPRTHHYFGHREYPLERMLAAGVRVALGTDSRASNPDLNLWNEVRFAARRHPTIVPETWLRMATLYGAEALGIDRHYGSLTVGKVGNFLVIPLTPDQRDNPWSWFDQDWKPLIFTNRH